MVVSSVPLLLYNTVTGDPGDPLYFPMNAVRWHTPPRDIAVMVTESTPSTFESRLYHFGDEERPLECELFLLKPGEYQYALVDVATGRPASRGTVRITEDNRRLALTVPQHREFALQIE